jgi:hypothetical protein
MQNESQCLETEQGNGAVMMSAHRPPKQGGVHLPTCPPVHLLQHCSDTTSPSLAGCWHDSSSSGHGPMVRSCAIVGTFLTGSETTEGLRSKESARRRRKQCVHIRSEVFTAVTMKNGVFWNVTPCRSCKNRCVGGTKCLLHQGDKNR